LKTGHSRRIQPLPPTHPRAACRALASILLLATLGSAPSAAQESSQANAKITLHGVVINSVTREPVAHALVVSPDNRLATFTDDQGRFEFAITPNSPDGQINTSESVAMSAALALGYPLTARKPGFLAPDGNPWNEPSFLAAGKLTIPLVPEALIVGRVLLPNSNGADRIEVTLYRRQVTDGRAQWMPAGSATSRSNGEFRFANLSPGTYKLLTGEQMDRDPLTLDPRGPIFGYPPSYFPNATDFLSAAPIQLTPGTTFQAELSPVRQPYYPVKVPITNATSDSQISISVSVQGRGGPGFSLGYNPRDQKIVGSLPNGIYVIDATSMRPSFTAGSTTITVKGGPVDGPALTLAPLATVRINARLDFKPDSDSINPSQPVQQTPDGQLQWRRSNLNVRLERADDFQQQNDLIQMRPPTGPQDDSLVFDNVTAGRYWVHVESSRGFAASITSGNLDLLRHPLVVGQGGNLAIDVTLRDDGAEISGSIENPDSKTEEAESTASDPAFSLITRRLGGTPAVVYCIPLPDSPGQVRQAAVTDGKFELQQVPPGAYRVLVFDRPQPELEYRDNEALRRYDTKGQIVRLGPGQKETLRLPLIASE
jgi:hypothetical protein